MKKFWRISAIFFIFTLFSCATKITTQVNRPAEIDSNGAESISVLPVSPSGSYLGGRSGSFTIDALSEIFALASDYVSYDEKRIASDLTDEIKKNLLSNGYFKVYDSSVVEKALSEGKTPEVDAYLLAKINSLEKNDDRQRIKVYENKDKFHYESEFRRSASISVTFSLIESKSSRILGEKSKSWSASASSVRHESEIPSVYSILKPTLASSASEICKSLAPYSVPVTLKLLNDKTKNPLLKEADAFAKNGNLLDADEIYSSVYAQDGNFTAGYNHALILQSRGNLDEAYKIMEELSVKSGDRRAVKALDSISYEISQRDKLKAQIEAKKAASSRSETSIDAK